MNSFIKSSVQIARTFGCRQFALCAISLVAALSASCDDASQRNNRQDGIKFCASDIAQCPPGSFCIQETDASCGDDCEDCTLNNEVCIDGACRCPNNMHHCGDNNACVAQGDDSCGDDCEDCTLNNEICIDGACRCPNNMHHCGDNNACVAQGDDSCGDDCTLNNEICIDGACRCPNNMHHCGDNNACVAQGDDSCGKDCEDCTLNNEICIDGACQCPNNMHHCGDNNACVAQGDDSCGDDCADCTLNNEICIDGTCQCPNNMHHCGDNNACVAQGDDSCGDDCADCTLNNEICIDGACQCPNNMRRCPNDNICAEPGDASCGKDCEDCTLNNEICIDGACQCPNNMRRCPNDNICAEPGDASCGDDCADCTLNNEICVDGACQCPSNMRRCPNDNICAEPGDASCGDDCKDCTLSGEYCRSGACVCLPHSYEFASLAASTEDLLLKLRQYPDETEFSLAEPHQTQATNALPVHIFEIRRLPTAGTTHIAYEGSTYKGERITLMAFHPDDQKWVKIASAPTDGNGDATLQAAISNDYVDPDSRVMRIMAVQELAVNGSDTFIFTGDTQNYTSSGYFSDGKPNGIYNAIMTYARDEYLAGRAAYFHHAGDMTNNTSGEVLFETEQKIASEAHKIIDDAGMPNGVSVGNHDTYLKLTGGEFTIRPYFEKWFPPSRYEKFFWYGKSNLSPASHFDHYVLVTIADRDFIFINSGYDEYPYDWLNAVASQYSHRIAVIGRHSYLSAGNLSPQGTLIYRNVIVKHDNIRLVLCGHTTERGYHYSSIPNQDRTILEIVVDHSNYYPAPEGFGAEGYLRIISFRDGKIINKTYSPYRKQCLTAQDGEGEEFELDFELPDTRRTLTSSFFEAYTDCSD